MSGQTLTTTATPDHAPSRGSGPGSSAAEAIKVFKALADPVRLRLLELIAAAPDGEICVCDVVAEFDLSQPTISHHLKLLRQAGLVEVEKRATWSYYSLRTGALAPAQAALNHLGRPAQL